MEESLMVYRRVDDEDRRSVIVGLRTGAEAILNSLSNQHITEIQQMGPELVAALQDVLAEH
jgi:DNA-binding MarR family transcriptional regulator